MIVVYSEKSTCNEKSVLNVKYHIECLKLVLKNYKKGVSAKVLPYFSVIPRLRRIFMSIEKSKELRWHYSHASQDGIMQYPVDSFAWKTIDWKRPYFASEPRNPRVGLATDGFNAFQNLSFTSNCWPIVIEIHNFPSHICMFQENLMLTLLILDPSQLGIDIDVYLQPLIDDLKGALE